MTRRKNKISAVKAHCQREGVTLQHVTQALGLSPGYSFQSAKNIVEGLAPPRSAENRLKLAVMLKTRVSILWGLDDSTGAVRTRQVPEVRA